jgi:glutathione S-transferase
MEAYAVSRAVNSVKNDTEECIFRSCVTRSAARPGIGIVWQQARMALAALNTVEPPILELANARLLEGDKPWNKERLPLVEDRVRGRLNQLSARLGDADRAFSAGDLMMVSVLLRLKSSGILNEFPNLAAYVAHDEARPAYKPRNWRLTLASHRPAD